MGFGGKNRKATRRVPWKHPHHPRARWARHVKRCTWDRVEVTLDGVPLQDVSEISFETMLDPSAGFETFASMRKAGEEAINNLMLGITQTMGLDASMAPRFRHDTENRCSAAVAIPDGDENDALVCELIDGHDDWHLDTTGSRWREDGGEILVQPAGTVVCFTAEVGVKP